MQTDESFQGRVYIGEPAVKFYLKEDMALQLLKPLYGLSDSGDIWYKRLDAHIKSDLKTVPCKVDPVYYLCSHSSKRLIGMNGSYVDDFLRTGNSKFKKLSQITH